MDSPSFPPPSLPLPVENSHGCTFPGPCRSHHTRNWYWPIRPSVSSSSTSPLPISHVCTSLPPPLLPQGSLSAACLLYELRSRLCSVPWRNPEQNPECAYGGGVVVGGWSVGGGHGSCPPGRACMLWGGSPGTDPGTLDSGYPLLPPPGTSRDWLIGGPKLPT